VNATKPRVLQHLHLPQIVLDKICHQVSLLSMEDLHQMLLIALGITSDAQINLMQNAVIRDLNSVACW